MASELTVQTLKGPTSGSNANKIILPAGHTLDASAGFVPPAGAVLQVKQNYSSTNTNITSSSFTSTDLFVNITPSSSSSKILVIIVGGSVYEASGEANGTIYRGSTNLGNSSYGLVKTAVQYHPYSMSVLDEPTTTNQLTYRMYWKTSNSVYPIYSSYGRVTMTAMEIAG